MGSAWKDGYSADVEIYLHIGDAKYRVAQVGGYSLKMRDMCTVPPSTAADLITIVDGRQTVRSVLLHEGISQDRRNVEFRST